MQTRYALPLTFVFVDDGTPPPGYAALACEIDVVSDGRDLAEALHMLQDAVGLWATHEVESGHADRLARPVPPEALAEFVDSARPENVAVQHYTLLLLVEDDPHPRVTSLEFVRSSVVPVCCPPRVAA